MQVMPATGRSFARRLGITPFATRRLTEPGVSVAIGTQYMDDMMQQFGGAHFALAAYNAGAHRVVRWRAERPGMPEDEWIDDIPFPETQNYVKRILGTAEDYRRLYGGGLLKPMSTSSSTALPPVKASPATPASKKPVAPPRRPTGRRRTLD